MGCGTSTPHSPRAKDPNQQDDSNPPKLKRTEKNNDSITPKINSISDLKLSTADLVSEKHGDLNKDYIKILPHLGEGGYGEVFKVIHKHTSVQRAAKIIKKEKLSEDEKKRLPMEVNILKKLDHPNIIKIFEFFQDPKHFYVITEFCSGGELFTRILEQGGFSEKKAADVIRQILSGVLYCHKNKIVHRDLKPENCLYESSAEDSIIKIIDFGTSVEYDPISQKKLTQKFGTPYYIAPEVLKRQYDEKCDVWSCGIILYILLCGYPPFNGNSDEIILKKINIGHFDFPPEDWNHISPDAKKLIKKMLEYEAGNRISAEEALNDPWIKKHTYTKLDKNVAQRVLNNLRQFQVKEKLHELMWMFIVSYLSTKEEKGELLKTFKSLDTNNDGVLSKNELLVGLKLYMDSKDAEEEVERIFKAVDVNGSGVLDYSEFVMATINKNKLLTKQSLETAFKFFDKDNSGYITWDELKDVFARNNLDIDNKIWEEMIKEVDKNSDGLISFKEFKEMLVTIPEPKPEKSNQSITETIIGDSTIGNNENQNQIFGGVYYKSTQINQNKNNEFLNQFCQITVVFRYYSITFQSFILALASNQNFFYKTQTILSNSILILCITSTSIQFTISQNNYQYIFNETKSRFQFNNQYFYKLVENKKKQNHQRFLIVQLIWILLCLIFFSFPNFAQLITFL